LREAGRERFYPGFLDGKRQFFRRKKLSGRQPFFRRQAMRRSGARFENPP